MQSFSSILVDIDAMAAAHPALDRAADVARRFNARLKVVDVMTIPARGAGPLPDGAEDAVIEARRERLQAFADATGVGADVAVLRGRPVEALVAEVRRGGHDLVVRSHARDLAATPRALGAIDMQLFRHCPCTVWAVGPGPRVAPRRIVAAVHADRSDALEQRLNARIIETALAMASVANGQVTIFQAWHPFAEDVLRTRYSPEDMDAYVAAAEREAQQELDHLLSSFGDRLQGVRTELARGHAEDVLPAYVVAQDVDLVVMGTVARAGLAGMLIGNTAERLLQRLPCSAMAVRAERARRKRS